MFLFGKEWCPSRPVRIGIRIAAGALLLLALLGLAMPRLVEWGVRRELAARGLEAVELEVRSLTPWSLEIAPFKIGSGADPLEVARIRAAYAPLELARGRIRSVEIDGLRIVVSRQSTGRWECPGLRGLKPKPGSRPSTLGPAQLLDKLPAKFILRNATLAVAMPAGRWECPLQMTASHPAPGQPATLSFGATLFGQPQTAEFTLTPGPGTMLEIAGQGAWHGGPPPIAGHTVAWSAGGQVESCTPPLLKLHVGGEISRPQAGSVPPWLAGASASLAGRFQADLLMAAGGKSAKAAATLDHIAVKLGARDLAVDQGTFSLAATQAGQQLDYALEARLLGAAGSEAGKWTVQAETLNLLAKKGPDTKETDLSCDLGQGGLTLQSPAAAIAAGGIEFHQAFTWSPEQGLRNAGGEPSKPNGKIAWTEARGLRLDPIPLSFLAEGKSLRLETSVKPQGSDLRTDLRLTVDLAAKTAAVTASIPAARLHERDPLAIAFLPPKLRGYTFSGTVSGGLEAKMALGGKPEGTARFTLADGQGRLPDGRIGLDGINGNGDFDLGKRLANVAMTLHPQGSPLALDLKIAADLLAKKATVSANLPEVVVSEQDPAIAPCLPPALKGAAFSARIAGRGDLVLDLAGGRQQGELYFSLADGRFQVQIPGKRYGIDGVAVSGKLDLGKRTAEAIATVHPKGSPLEIKAKLAADLENRNASASWVLPETAVSEADPLLSPYLPPGLKGSTFSGLVSGHGDAWLKLGGPVEGIAELAISQGRFSAPGGRYGLNGVATAWTFDLGRRTGDGTVTVRPAGSVLAADLKIQADLGAKKVTVSGSLPETTITEQDPLLSPLLPPKLKGTSLSGKVSGQCEAVLRLGGGMEGTARFALNEGRGRTTLKSGVSVPFGDLSIKGEADLARMALTATGTLLPPGSALAVDLKLLGDLKSRRFNATAILPPTRITQADPLLAPLLPPKLKSASFSGEAAAEVNAVIVPGTPLAGTAKFTFKDGQFKAADGKYDVSGLAAEMRLEELWPPRSAPAQPITFTVAHVLGSPLENGAFAIRFDPPYTLFLEDGSMEWCGGQLTCAAVRMVGGRPQGPVMLRADRVDIGRLCSLMKDFSGHAEGYITGKIPLVFGKDGVRLGDAFLSFDPERPGSVQLDPDKWPSNKLDMVIREPTARKMTKQTLKDMRLETFRLEVSNNAQKGETKINFHIAGSPRADKNLPPVDLNVNFNIEDMEGGIWKLLNQKMGLTPNK